MSEEELLKEIQEKASRRLISTTVYLEQVQLTKLKLISKRTEVPMAELIRDGVDAVIRGYDQEEVI